MKLFVFDMDGTLLRGRTILYLAREFGFYEQAKKIIEGPITGNRSQRLASLLKGVRIGDLIGVVKRIPLTKGAEETINAINAMGHRTAIVTDSYDIVAEHFKERLRMDRAVGLKLVVDRGRVTGEIEMPSNCPTKEECGYPSICKRQILLDMAGEFGVPSSETVAIGDNRVDICMIREAGIGIAFNPKVGALERAADVVVKNQDLRHILRNVTIK